MFGTFTGSLAVGAGAMFVKGGTINSATVDNGVVQVTDSQKTVFGPWLTGHYLSNKCFWASLRCGPFVGIQVGTGSANSSVISSMALGVSAAAPSTDDNPQDSNWVLNAGYGATTRKVLAPGYVQGQPLPSGSSQPVIANRTGYGPVIIFSYQVGSTPSSKKPASQQQGQAQAAKPN